MVNVVADSVDVSAEIDAEPDTLDQTYVYGPVPPVGVQVTDAVVADGSPKSKLFAGAPGEADADKASAPIVTVT